MGGDLRLVDQAAALISRSRMSRSDTMRASASARSCAIRGLLHLFAAGDLRLLRLGVAQRTLAGELGALHRAPHLDVAFLIEARGFAFAVDFERLLFGFEVAAADQDHGFLFDVVAQLATRLDVLDELGQAFGIETVRRIEEFKIGLVEIGDRDGFKFEAVLL